MNQQEYIVLMVSGSALFMIWWIMHPLMKKKFKVKGMLTRHRHRRKEQKVLDLIIKDLKANPGHWVQNGYCPVTFKAPALINDNKNMAIRYGRHNDNVDEVMIQYGLKDVSKLDLLDEDAIATRIHGKSAQKFINTIVKILDERGRELDYFAQRLKERL